MPIGDLRDFLAHLEENKDLKRIEGAHWDLEIGTLSELCIEQPNHPALLFDNIPGYPQGYRVLTNSLSTIPRTAIALGLSAETSGLEVLRHWRTKMGSFQPLAPHEGQEGPILENIVRGADINMWGFPSPKWHEADGGRFLGTGCAVILRDPDTGGINVGAYRMMVHDEDTLGLLIIAGKDGDHIVRKYHERGQNAPVAVTFGHEPVIFLAAGTFLPPTHGELEFAGWLKEEPISVIRGELTGLPIPASAEIAIEGEIPSIQEDQREEGPFGEWTGYYAGDRLPRAVVKVKRVMHRDDPIIYGAPPFRPPLAELSAVPFWAGSPWDALESSGIEGVKGVWQYGTSSFITVVAIEQKYAGHPKQAGLIAAGAKGGAYCARWVIVVDDDVNIMDMSEVIWAVTTRARIPDDYDLIRDGYSSGVDPVHHPEVRRKTDPHELTNHRFIINACRPYAWKDDFSMVNKASAELRERVTQKFRDVLEMERTFR
jgi:4-hydroxy-3-polyprenylbenzoate decarboxylase